MQTKLIFTFELPIKKYFNVKFLPGLIKDSQKKLAIPYCSLPGLLYDTKQLGAYSNFFICVISPEVLIVNNDLSPRKKSEGLF